MCFGEGGRKVTFSAEKVPLVRKPALLGACVGAATLLSFVLCQGFLQSLSILFWESKGEETGKSIRHRLGEGKKKTLKRKGRGLSDEAQSNLRVLRSLFLRGIKTF